jgi:hypothetical protein
MATERCDAMAPKRVKIFTSTPVRISDQAERMNASLHVLNAIEIRLHVITYLG